VSSNPHTAYRSQDILTVVLGGGAGTRLFPLTKDRAKPAVPLAGKYRLVDIPISNCINSDLRRIFVLTQFNSSSLHRHIHDTYRFDHFTAGSIEILAAQQTPLSMEWYQGTADAVRHNLVHLSNYPHRFVLVLSGDQLYRMNYRTIVQRHLATEAEVTVATIPVTPSAAAAFGIMQVGRDGRIVRFVEKPKDPEVLASLATDWSAFGEIPAAGADAVLGSMGIYLFDRAVLEDALRGSEADFGKHLIPKLIDTRRVFAHMHQGYWEDIGTIRSFYEANLDLCEPVPQFNFYDATAPVFTHARYLPPTKTVRCRMERAVIADGCIIIDAEITRSLVGVRSRIHAGAVIRDSLLMGADFYETPERARADAPPMGIGEGTLIERAIVDKNARIGRDVRITPGGQSGPVDGDNFYVRDGIVVIPKNAIVPDGTVI
jgi:glucose-1-phosphate adenylyltransferase